MRYSIAFWLCIVCFKSIKSTTVPSTDTGSVHTTRAVSITPYIHTTESQQATTNECNCSLYTSQSGITPNSNDNGKNHTPTFSSVTGQSRETPDSNGNGIDHTPTSTSVTGQSTETPDSNGNGIDYTPTSTSVTEQSGITGKDQTLTSSSITEQSGITGKDPTTTSSSVTVQSGITGKDPTTTSSSVTVQYVMTSKDHTPTSSSVATPVKKKRKSAGEGIDQTLTSLSVTQHSGGTTTNSDGDGNDHTLTSYVTGQSGMTPNSNNNYYSKDGEMSSDDATEMVSTISVNTIPYEGTHDHCRVVCAKITTDSGFSLHTESTILPTEKYPHTDPDWENIQINVTLQIVVIANFSEQLSDKSSQLFKNYSAIFTETLTKKYNSTPGFKEIIIVKFTSGSIDVEFKVLLDLGTEHENNGKIQQHLKSVAGSWDNVSISSIGIVNANKTKELQEDSIKEELKGCSLEKKLCPRSDHKCEGKKFGEEKCVYKCKDDHQCKNGGECYVKYDGSKKCECKSVKGTVYFGDTCEHYATTITTTDPSKEKIQKEKKLIIYIASGVGGGLVFIFLVILGCVCKKWRDAEKNIADDYLDGGSNLDIENYKIENIPVNGFNGERNSVRMQNISSQVSKRNGDHLDSSGQRINPVFDDDSNQDYKSTTKDFTHSSEAKTDLSYYNSIQYAKSEQGPLMYQPSNIQKPIQRDSTSSVGDNRIDVNPLPYGGEIGIGSRMSFYENLDTQKKYEIKRPNVRTRPMELR